MPATRKTKTKVDVLYSRGFPADLKRRLHIACLQIKSTMQVELIRMVEAFCEKVEKQQKKSHDN